MKTGSGQQTGHADDGDGYAFQRRLGERLRRVREEQRLTLRAVEVLSRDTQSTVILAAYEPGDRALKVETVAELAWLYQVPLKALLGGDDG